MKITLTAILGSNGELIVQFASEYGEATAGWIGAAPAPNCQYDVELDCDETLMENTNFKLADSPNPRIVMDGEMIQLTTVVEGVYEDTSTATLRLGDSVLLVDYEGTFPSVGIWIELRIRKLSLNDIGT
jgi:hypothetical protein